MRYTFVVPIMQSKQKIAHDTILELFFDEIFPRETFTLSQIIRITLVDYSGKPFKGYDIIANNLH